MPFAPYVETKSHAEYMFAGWIHDLKYQCETVQMEFKILSTELLDESVTEESIRFEVHVIDGHGKEHIAYTEEEVKKLVREAREETPDQTIKIKLWHWATPVSLPPLDNERVGHPPVPLRHRHIAELSKIMAEAYNQEHRLLMHDAIIRGILDAVLCLNLNLAKAHSEHEVRNIVLQALGRKAPPLPEPWEFQVVLEFADGGDVILVDEDRQRANEILSQEIARRKKHHLPLDCFFRRRRRDDRFVTYIHPAPTRRGR
jgi:hypothetical protein